MHNINDLLTIKSKEPDARRDVLEEFASFCSRAESVDLVRIIAADELINTTANSREDVMRYCLLAIYAEDISTVPDNEERQQFSAGLEETATEFGLSYSRIVYLTRYAAAFIEEIERGLIAMRSR